MPQIDLLVLGGSDFVGGRTAQAAQCAGLTVACTHYHRPAPVGIPAYQIESGDLHGLTACLLETRPRGVIYSVVTNSFGGSHDTDHIHTSVEGLRVLLAALRASEVPARLVYVSTNSVFSGRDGPYGEVAVPDPEIRQDAYRWYGLARRAGEKLALEEWPDSLVARTVNAEGRDALGKFNPRMQRLIDALREESSLARHVDRTISPTLVDNLADALVEATSPDFALPVSTGRILHLAGCEPLTDFDYAGRVAGRLGLPESRVLEDHYLPPGSRERYNIALDVARTQALLHTRLIGVDGLLDRVLG